MKFNINTGETSQSEAEQKLKNLMSKWHKVLNDIDPTDEEQLKTALILESKEKWLMKKLVTFSGGMDSLAIMLEYKDKYGPENIISLGFNYGQRHFKMENAAACRFCNDFNIKRIVLDIPIGQIGGCSLVDHSIPVTTDMSQQRSTVVPMRNAIFLMTAAAVAQVQGCDVITHGACAEDDSAYRDCRLPFFRLMEAAIQAGLTNPINGSEAINEDLMVTFRDNDTSFDISYGLIKPGKIDIKIETPLILEKKETTMARILKTYPVDIYKYSYSCYNGGEQQCGLCPACFERKHAFDVNGVVDPVGYKQ